MKSLLSTVATLFVFAMAPGAYAAEAGVPLNVVTAPPGVTYAQGGVGSDSVAKIDELARTRSFNVKLTFAWHAGNFVAGVPVTIHDANGNKIFALPDSDPIVLLHLKEGRYTAAAMYDGKIEKRSFDAPVSGLAVVRFSWPQPQASRGIAAR